MIRLANKNRGVKGFEGQAMLLTITIVVGALLGATTIAGFLMVRQIRQSTLSTQSTQAIFAAETGIEYALYKEFGVNSSTQAAPVLPAGIGFEISSSTRGGVLVIKSVGTAGFVSRALQIVLTPL